MLPLILLGLGLGRAPVPASVVSVSAAPTVVIVQLAGVRSAVELREARPWSADALPRSLPVVWRGKAGTTCVRLPRRGPTGDRLFSGFTLTGPGLRSPKAPRFVTDIGPLRPRRQPFLRAADPKGITCPVDLDDIAEIGAKYVNDNITLSQILSPASPGATESIQVDGERFAINAAYIHGLDERFRRLTHMGIDITVVINNPVPRSPDRSNPLIHPRTDCAGAPTHLGAFNLTDERGLRAYRAAIGYMAERYSRPGAPNGWVAGYIVGNEVQQHWVWYNLGRATPDAVARHYEMALRVTDLIVRSAHSGIRVYASMDHHWTKRGASGDPLVEARGDELLDALNALGKRHGDFPWNVAFHPYPDNLFEPRFWLDHGATLRFDTPKITFRNLEVLPAFLSQPRLRYRGAPRRIILSEQGFHAADSPEGEANQAAAYALAYVKVRAMPTIDAFMLHRHVSARDEGGLRLGLWSWDPSGPTGFEPGRKLRSWQVFRAAGTNQQDEAFAFALPIIGLRSWDEARRTGRVVAAPIRPLGVPTALISLVDRMSEARRSNVQDWRMELSAEEGPPRRSIFQHPPQNGDGEAAFGVVLPRPLPGRRLVLRFGVAITGATSNGVRYSVAVDGAEIWGEDVLDRTVRSREIDISEYAGRRISLALRTNARGDAGGDWSTWVEPRIEWKGTK